MTQNPSRRLLLQLNTNSLVWLIFVDRPWIVLIYEYHTPCFLVSFPRDLSLKESDTHPPTYFIWYTNLWKQEWKGTEEEVEVGEGERGEREREQERRRVEYNILNLVIVYEDYSDIT